MHVNKKINTVILVPHEYHVDPRVHWLVNNLSDEYHITVISINYTLHVSLEYFIDNNILHLMVNPQHMKKEQFDVPLLSEINFNLPYHYLFSFETLFSKSDTEFSHIFQSTPEDERGPIIKQFKSYCNYFYSLTYAFLFAVKFLGKISQVIAVDIYSLLAGVIIAKRQQAFLMYDAHEFEPYSIPSFSAKEVEFWLELYKTIIKYVDLPVTVNELIATEMSKLYSVQFLAVPNAECKNNNFENFTPRYAQTQDDNSNICIFLYQGGYAAGRGLEQLINNWLHTHENCHLYLRGPHNDFVENLRKLAESLQLLNNRIFFDDPVSEAELIGAASKADVGIIPYDPFILPNHELCCPNKLSQYMAAGLPIVANQLLYVGKILQNAQAGFALNFAEQQKFTDMIHQLADNVALRRQLGKNAHEYFLNHFNWESLSGQMYKELGQANKIEYYSHEQVITLISEEIKPVVQEITIQEEAVQAESVQVESVIIKHNTTKLVCIKIFNRLTWKLSIKNKIKLIKFIKVIVPIQ